LIDAMRSFLSRAALISLLFAAPLASACSSAVPPAGSPDSSNVPRRTVTLAAFPIHTRYPNCPGRCEGLIHGGETFTQVFDLSTADYATVHAATWSARLVLDDHYSTQGDYRLSFALDGRPLAAMSAKRLEQVPHGQPYAGNPFQNFVVVEFPLPADVLGRLSSGTHALSVTLDGVGEEEWVAISSAELHVTFGP
jgi:hypothetical protein